MSDSQGWKPRANPWLVAIIVTLGAFMEVLDTTIVNVVAAAYRRQPVDQRR